MKKAITFILILFTTLSIFATNLIGVGFTGPTTRDAAGKPDYSLEVKSVRPDALSILVDVSAQSEYLFIDIDFLSMSTDYVGTATIGGRYNNTYIGVEVRRAINPLLTETSLGGKVRLTTEVGLANFYAEGYARKYFESIINEYDIRENGFSCGMSLGASLSCDYAGVEISAGFESWQDVYSNREPGRVGQFDPIAIRNSFDFIGYVGSETIKLYCDIQYYCDHPEAGWKPELYEYQQNVNHEVVSFGIAISF